jgi:hypothetical protein
MWVSLDDADIQLLQRYQKQERDPPALARLERILSSTSDPDDSKFRSAIATSLESRRQADDTSHGL